jgi:tetratricopeptide (TPR) repeat protein
MRHLKKSLLTLWLACSTLLAQMNPHEPLHQVWLFVQQGQFGKAIDLAKPLIDSNELSGIDLGRACLMLGVAYGGDGKFAEARSALERSLRILNHDREHVTDYAAALDNYAALYNDAGQLDIAGQMWHKALALRQQSGDHTGATRSFINLAGLALAQHRIREANRYLKRANGEMKWSRDLIDDDFATLFETEGWLALAEGNSSMAVAKYQGSLEICKRTRGEQHWLTGWEYMLRGKAYAQSGNMDRALADMRTGVIILDHALGNKNPKYFTAQIAYSQILDRTGSHVEAAQVKAAAEQASQAFYRDQCVGCTINVAAFR